MEHWVRVTLRAFSLRIEPATSEVKGERSDHRSTEAPSGLGQSGATDVRLNAEPNCGTTQLFKASLKYFNPLQSVSVVCQPVSKLPYLIGQSVNLVGQSVIVVVDRGRLTTFRASVRNLSRAPISLDL